MQQRWIGLAFSLLLLALLWGGHHLYQSQIHQTQTKAQEQLWAIARLKTEQIAAWRKERLGDGEVLGHNAHLTGRLLSWLNNPRDADAPGMLRDALAEFQRQYGYQDHWLVNARGQMLIHNGAPASGELSGELQAAVADAWHSRRASLSEIYRGTQHPYPHMALVVPLFEGDAPAGALLLAIDVRRVLYPLIQSWPIPSDTAEILLVRLDGNDALFLNDVRQNPNAALSLRIPLTQSHVPAVQAVMGNTGLIEGPDYRGVPVLAVSLPIQESPWFLVAKVDRTEIYAEPRREALFLGGWLLSVLALLLGLLAFFWQRHRFKLEEQLHRAEAARLESLQEFQNLFEQSSDGILLLTRDHRFLDANPAALQLLGYELEELKTLGLAQVLAPHEWARFDRDVPEMMAGSPHRGEWVCKRRDGSTFIAESTAKALDQSRYFSYFRDITQQIRAEEALKASELKFSLAFQSSPYAIVITRQSDGKILEVNPAFEALSGYPRQDAVGKTTLELGMWVDVQERERFLTDLRQEGRVDQREYRFCRRDGTAFTGLISARPLDLQGEPVLLGSILDISERQAAEQALRAEADLREQLRQFADTVPGVVYVYRLRSDGSGDCPYISSRVTELYGVTPEQAAKDAQFMIDLVHPDDLDAFLASIQDSAHHLSPWHAEFRIRHPYRGIVWIEAMSTPKAETDGSIVWHGFLFDMSERKETERALRLSQFSLQHASDAVYWIRPDSTIFYVNDAACTMLGYRRDQLTRMGVTDLDADYQGDHWREHFAQLKQEGSIRLETTHRACDGYVIPVEVSANYITFEGAEYNCAVVRDITDRKRAEQAILASQRELERRVAERTRDLAASEERFRLAMEATEEGLWDWSVQTGDCYYSPGWFRMLGYEPEALAARIDTWIDALHPDEREAIVAEAGDRLAAAGGYELEFRLRTATGGYVWVVSRGKVVQRDADGKPVRAVGTHIDITEHRLALQELADLNRNLEQKVAERTAQLQAASAAKSQFLAHMSHEIRTPMNAVLGLSQLLEKEPLRPGELAMVRHIRESGDSLLHIINDILDFSKIEAGQLRLDPQPFTVPAVLTRVDHLLRNTAENKGLALDVRESPTDLGVLLGDPLRLEQILINLTGNAIKFTAEGRVSLSVRPVTSDETPVRVRFEVQDTGIGIAPDVIGQLFKPFSQADASITRHFGGTGLGLAISRRLIDLMGGEMGVTSQVGQGSTFWFEVPFRVAARQETRDDAIEVQKEAQPVGPQLPGLRVLAVDDSRLNLMVVERALMCEGASVTLAADGQQALQILKAQPRAFDVVLMDIQMPVMDGLTATREIRKDAALAQLPVIALTAGVLPEERQAALDAGVNDFLAKPLDLQTMTAMLAPYSGHSREA